MPTARNTTPRASTYDLARERARLMQLYRWRWRKRLPERHGELFVVLARGSLNSCLIRFEVDGWIAITSRNALRKASSSPVDAPVDPA